LRKTKHWKDTEDLPHLAHSVMVLLENWRSNQSQATPSSGQYLRVSRKRWQKWGNTSLLKGSLWIKTPLVKEHQAVTPGALSFQDLVKSRVLCARLLHSPSFGW